MRKLFLLTAILLFTVSISAQSRQQKLYNGTLATSGASTIDTDEYYAKDFGTEYDWKGRFDLSIRVPNVAGTADVVAVVPHYLIGDTWIEGDTTTWNTNTKDDVFSATQRVLYPQRADSAKTYLYKMDPTENSLTGMSWDAMYWTIVSKNAASHWIILFMHPY